MDQEEFMHLNTTYSSVDIIDYMGTDKTVVDSARVSYNKDDLFKEVIDGREIDYPAEYGYGLVANKWFFKEFSGRIGLIGASEKLYLIVAFLNL